MAIVFNILVQQYFIPFVAVNYLGKVNFLKYMAINVSYLMDTGNSMHNK